MSQTVVLLREIKAPRAVLEFERALPGPVMLHDGLYWMHCGLFNGLLLADADFHAIGQFLTGTVTTQWQYGFCVVFDAMFLTLCW